MSYETKFDSKNNWETLSIIERAMIFMENEIPEETAMYVSALDYEEVPEEWMKYF